MIALIGYRGTGKTTVGRILAHELGWQFVDADEELVRRAGLTIKEIFAAEGEDGFRRRESDVVADLLGITNCVVATGGGVVTRPENREPLRRAFVAWLTAPAETIFARISADPSTTSARPNLTAAGGLDEVREVLTRREPLYREWADAVVETEGRSPNGVAGDILTLWKSSSTATCRGSSPTSGSSSSGRPSAAS